MTEDIIIRNFYYKVSKANALHRNPISIEDYKNIRFSFDLNRFAESIHLLFLFVCLQLIIIWASYKFDSSLD